MSYSLPAGQYSGTAGYVNVSYNAETQGNVQASGDANLKRLLEEMAVQAAMERGLQAVQIRSGFHNTTIQNGTRVADQGGYHVTITAGTGANRVSGHVYVSNYQGGTNYNGVTYNYVQWADQSPPSGSQSSGATPTAGTYYPGIYSTAPSGVGINGLTPAQISAQRLNGGHGAHPDWYVDSRLGAPGTGTTTAPPQQSTYAYADTSGYRYGSSSGTSSGTSSTVWYDHSTYPGYEAEFSLVTNTWTGRTRRK